MGIFENYWKDLSRDFYLDKKEPAFKESFYLKINNKAHYERVQRALFKLGVCWADESRRIDTNETRSIYYYNNEGSTGRGVIRRSENFDISDSRKLYQYKSGTFKEVLDYSTMLGRKDYVTKDGKTYLILEKSKTKFTLEDIKTKNVIKSKFSGYKPIDYSVIKNSLKAGDICKVLKPSNGIRAGMKAAINDKYSDYVYVSYIDSRGNHVSRNVSYIDLYKVSDKIAPNGFNIGDRVIDISGQTRASFHDDIYVLYAVPKHYKVKGNYFCVGKKGSDYGNVHPLKNFVVTEISDLTQVLLSKSLSEKIYKIYNNTKNVNLSRMLKLLLDKAYTKPFDSTVIRNLTINTNKELTYCPVGKDSSLSSDQRWSQKGRQSGKYGKTIRKVFNQVGATEYTDSDIEEFVNLLKSNVADGEFRVVEGQELVDIYCSPKFGGQNTGSLSGSCMNEKPESYFSIYRDNCRMVIMEDKDGYLLGRAILWTTSCGKKFMDRVYASDSNTLCFFDWAKDNGYWRKRFQSYDDYRDFIDNEGEEQEIDMEVKLVDQYEYYPYMDTFKFSEDLTYLTNNSDHNSHCLNSTDGNTQED